MRGRQGRRARRSASSSRARCSTGCAPATTTARSASSTSCPKGMRRSLYLKDDDYRLSFLYGNFTTLTRFTEADLERVVTEQLGPLYVSIHATDPDAPDPAAAQPARRDEPALARARCSTPASRCTARSSCARASTTATCSTTRCSACSTASRGSRRVGVVPLGVSDAHHRARDAPAHARRGRARCSTSSTRGRRASLAALGRRLVYAVRRVLPARRPPVPGARRVRRLRRSTRTASAWRARSSARCGPRSRATTVDGQRHPHRLLRLGRRRARRGLPRAPRDAIASRRRCGRATAATPRRSRSSPASTARAVLAPLLADARRPSPARRCGSCPVANRFFGGNIAVTGLLTGADVAARARRRARRATATCCPTSCSRTAGSSTARTLADLPRPVEVVATDGASLVAALAHAA